MLLSRWVEVAPTPGGLLQGRFNGQWQPNPAQGGSLVAHSRLIYSMMAGYESTGERRYFDAAIRGADFLLEHFRDSTHGGFFEVVDAQGKVIHSNKRAYSHAFALFALSHVARVTKDPRYRAAALTAWEEINLHLRDRDGGFRPDAPRDFAPSSGGRTQNPVMHMFEALLALADATDDPRALAGAQSVGNFVLYKLLQGQPDGGAYIAEWYDGRWIPVESKDGGAYVDLGHQFEWVHLLMSAAKKGLPSLYGSSADRLLQYALKYGYDESDGGVFNRVYPDGSIDRHKYFWQQAEGLRTLMVAASASNRSDLWRRYDQTRELIETELVDPQRGGWRSAVKKTCEARRCDDEQPDPYHMIGMHVTAINLARAK